MVTENIPENQVLSQTVHLNTHHGQILDPKDLQAMLNDLLYHLQENLLVVKDLKERHKDSQGHLEGQVYQTVEDSLQDPQENLQMFLRNLRVRNIP